MIKNVTQTFKSYSFEDKISGFKFQCKVTNTVDFVNNTAKMAFTDIILVKDGVEFKTKKMSITMTAAEIDQINMGEEIGDDLGGIEGHIVNVVLPYISQVTEDALEQGNAITVKGIDTGSDINAGAGNDTVIGGAGNDTLIAGQGNDRIMAGDGADLIIGGDGAGNDFYDGGNGIDAVYYTSAKAAIHIDLTKGTAKSIAAGDAAGIGSDKLKGIENIIGGDFADILKGSKDSNVIVGGAGNDSMDGGLGSDTLEGGLGSDVFILSTKPSATNVDVITDFEVGVDKIQLSLKTFTKLKGATDYFVSGSPTTATQYLSFDSTTGKLSYDADGFGVKFNAVEIAIIVGEGLDLSTSDFVVV